MHELEMRETTLAVLRLAACVRLFLEGMTVCCGCVVLPSDGETVDPEIVLSKQEMRFYRRSKDLMEQMEDLGEAATAGELQEHYENMKKLQAHFAQRCLRSRGDPSYTNTRMKSLNADAALAIFSYKRSIGI